MSPSSGSPLCRVPSLASGCAFFADTGQTKIEINFKYYLVFCFIVLEWRFAVSACVRLTSTRSSSIDLTRRCAPQTEYRDNHVGIIVVIYLCAKHRSPLCLVVAMLDVGQSPSRAQIFHFAGIEDHMCLISYHLSHMNITVVYQKMGFIEVGSVRKYQVDKPLSVSSC